MSEKESIRIYVDTSVFGGCFDEEFAEASRAFFELIRAGRFKLVLSEITLRELGRAPRRVKELLASLPIQNQERISSSDVIEDLRDSYVDEGVITAKSRVDAWHIAAATHARVDLMVSWNFKHIVHFEKIEGYHKVNRSKGYPEIPIYSPLEVI